MLGVCGVWYQTQAKTCKEVWVIYAASLQLFQFLIGVHLARRTPQPSVSHWPCLTECHLTDTSHEAAVHPLPKIRQATHLHVPAADTMLSAERWKSFPAFPSTVNNESGTSSLIMTLIIYNGFRCDKKTRAAVVMPSFPILISMDLAALTLNSER